MNVQQCLDRLAVGELANTYFVDGDQIKDDKVSFIVSLINEALLRLYSRFSLKVNSVLVELNELKTSYELTKDHVYLPEDDEGTLLHTCTRDYDKYIFQTPEHPFTEDIIKITNVTGADGYEYPLNNPTEYYSVFTPVYNIIQVPVPDDREILSIVYQAKHPILTLDNLEQELELPSAFYGALFAYIANLAYSSMQSENALATAQKYFSQYTALLDELVTYDIGSTSHSQTNTKFYNNGWC